MAISTYVTLESELQFYILEISVEVYLYYGIKQWKHGGHFSTIGRSGRIHTPEFPTPPYKLTHLFQFPNIVILFFKLRFKC